MKLDPYKKIAKFYDGVFEPLNRGLRAIGLKMFPPKAGMKVLDVGCGTGVHLELYQRAGCKVFGIDLSPSMLGLARNRLGTSANLHLGDASRMHFQQDEFDLIIMSTVLHEMPPEVRRDVVNESIRVLKDDGRILLIDFHLGPIRPVKEWIYKIIIYFSEVAAGREHFKNYRNYLANNGLPGLISMHGLLVEMEKIVSGGNIALFLLRENLS